MNNSAKQRILLIDDEPGVIFALRLMLETLGCAVVSFEAAKPALEVLREDREFDYILCDLRMPEIDGFEALTEVKKITPDIPFILISGHATEDDIKEGTTLGISGFLGKPFSADELKKILGH